MSAEPTPFRIPYVGDGPDGCRRSAQIDREQADGLPTGRHQPGWSPVMDERRTALLMSAAAWEAQAIAFEARAERDGATWRRVKIAAGLVVTVAALLSLCWLLFGTRVTVGVALLVAVLTGVCLIGDALGDEADTREAS